MAFQSFAFLLFLPLTAAACLPAARRNRKLARALLLVASAVFYLWGQPFWQGFGVLLAGSCVTYAASRRFISGRGTTAGRRRVILAAAVWHIGVLTVFKYTGFFTGGVLAMPFAPLGLSFFTFQQLWFLREVWTGAVSGRMVDSLRGDDFTLFGFFFPTVVSGPILRPGAFFPQLRSKKFLRPGWDDAAAGLYAIAMGMGKKTLLADSLGVVVNNGYAHLADLTAPAAWLVILGYTLQLYFDFSGYCDIATGAARLLSVRLPVNFDSPYRSLSVGEFWKRWHITLTTFLRECLYFPLGGGRQGTAKTYRNILIVFLVSGFWHGAGWTFLLWGLLHGLAQILERALGARRDILPKWVQWTMTFAFVNLAWVFFRAPTVSAAGQMLAAALTGGGGIPPWLAEGLLASEADALGVLGFGGHAGLALLLIVYGLALVLALKPGNTIRRMEDFRPTAWRCALACCILAGSVLSFSGVSTFIYANF